MSVLTNALFTALKRDLSGRLDEYQLSKLDDDSYKIWPDATLEQYECWALGKSLLKKFNEEEAPSLEACNRALAKFLSVNERNKHFDINCDTLADEELVNGVSDELYRFWYLDGDTPLVDTLYEVYERGTLGKGSNRCARGADMYTKVYDSVLSHTNESLRFIWEESTKQHPTQLQAEQQRGRVYGFRRVEGNSLSFVNKNVTIARTIATEPTINMWYQLGLGAILTDRLASRYGISLDTQPDVNRAMARRGSVDGSLATIDLESASDSLSLNMCMSVLPRGMLSLLALFRSPTTTLPSREVVELHSMSTMGNGYTFPLQTMLFSAVVLTCYKRLGIRPAGFGPSDKRNYAVFGDDIIVVTEAVPLVLRLLKLLGFVVNQDKTYVEGPFRESCGHDWYRGSWVRGIYIKSLKSQQDLMVSINSLNRWSAITQINIPESIGVLMRALESKCDRRGVLYGPSDEPDDACVHVPLDMARGVERTRYGTVKYQAWYSRSSFLEYYPETDSLVTHQASKQAREEPDRLINPDGLFLSALLGVVRGYRIGLRQAAVRYGTKRRLSINWDNPPTSVRERYSNSYLHAWRHWSSAVRSNLP
jgi:hypothetical protein